MAVPRDGDVNPGGKVDVLIAVHVFERTTASRLKRNGKELDLGTQSLEITLTT